MVTCTFLLTETNTAIEHGIVSVHILKMSFVNNYFYTFLNFAYEINIMMFE